MSAKITTSDWAAWVNLMMPGPTPSGTLHVVGKVDTHSANFAFLEKAVPQGINPAILLLNLRTEIGIAPAANPQKVSYTEALSAKISTAKCRFGAMENWKPPLQRLKKYISKAGI